LFYFIFVGGYPLFGKKVSKYMINHGILSDEDKDALRILYGKMALFAFDPNDNSNEIRGLKDHDDPELYNIQVRRWDRLPDELKKCFISTFSDGLSYGNRHKRTNDNAWIKIFQKLKNDGLMTCECGKKNFSENIRDKKCSFCGKSLLKELSSVTFNVLSGLEPKNQVITVIRKFPLHSSQVYPKLNETLFRIEYSKSRNELSAFNLSQFSWEIHYEKALLSICHPNERVILKVGLIIVIIKKQLQLTVKAIN
jgi:hypothetical protein